MAPDREHASATPILASSAAARSPSDLLDCKRERDFANLRQLSPTFPHFLIARRDRLVYRTLRGSDLIGRGGDERAKPGACCSARALLGSQFELDG
jgi:hypothetical protein